MIRIPVHNNDLCDLAGPTTFCEGNPPMALMRNGPLYQFWQTGMPPNDYWPLAVALLTAEGAATIVLSRRRPAAN